jgi:transcription initiation factor TFIIIB Brf1 subunit/transcription initiation factor TFIIB
MKTYQCPKCNSQDLTIIPKGSQTGLYCKDCGRWIKWLPKDEIILAENFIKSQSNPKQFTINELEMIRISVDQWKNEYASKEDYYKFFQLYIKIENMINELTK